MSTQTATAPQMTLPKKVPWLFALNTFTQQFGIYVTLQFLNSFLTDFAMMATTTVAGILSIGRIVDLIVSLFAGSIVQKANLKTGPYRTWILVNGPLITIGVFLIFLNPNVGAATKVTIIIIGYFFRNIPQNFLLSAQNALLAKTAGANMANRLELTAKNTIGSNSAAIICSFATLPLIKYFETAVGPGKGYLVVGTVYGLIMAIGQAILYFALKEYDKYDPELKNVQGSSVNIKLSTIYGTTLKNGQVWILLIMYTLTQIAMFTMTPLNIYYYNYVLGSNALFPITMTLASFVALLGSMINPIFVKKLGKKNTVLLSYFSSSLVYVAVAFSGGNAILYMVVYLLARYTLSIAMIVGVNLWLDAAEYGLYTTGQDTRPFVMSINAITMKIGQFISSFTYVAILAFGKFDNTVKPPTADPKLLAYGIGFGMAIMYFAAAVVMIFFKVTEDKAKFYAEENKKMMEERAATLKANAAEPQKA